MPQDCVDWVLPILERGITDPRPDVRERFVRIQQRLLELPRADANEFVRDRLLRFLDRLGVPGQTLAIVVEDPSGRRSDPVIVKRKEQLS